MKMSKILNFKDFKRRKASINGSLDNNHLEKIMEILEIEQEIVEELFQMTEKYLKQIGYNPSDFVIDDDYVRELLSADMIEFMEGGGSGTGIIL